MRQLPRFLLILPLLCLGLTTGAAAKKEKSPLDTPPQLISTQGGGPKWKNTKELQTLAAKGDPQACFELGARLLEGDDEVVADLPRSRALLEKAAAGGVADAQFRLGKIYHDARGVPRDYTKALEYYAAAARQGVPEAQHNIGAMLVSARGVKRNYVEGLAWLIVAEQSGAASEAPLQVRERLAQRPADIHAAETRAKELLADLPNAIVRSGGASTLPLPPVIARPVVSPAVAAPRIDPVAPPKITVPLEPPPSLAP